MNARGTIAAVVGLSLALAACAAPPRSVRVSRYADGTTRWEYETVGGLPHGVSATWHRNGNRASAGAYREGKRHGLFRFYDEQGQFERQQLYFDGESVWSSENPGDEPPRDLLETLERLERHLEPGLSVARVIPGRDGPERFFTTLDRTTPLDRVGILVGYGGQTADGPQLTTSRAEVFGSYSFGRYGVYGQAAMSSLLVNDSRRFDGKRTFEAGATRHVTFGDAGDLSTRLGLMVPVGGDDLDGFIAGTESAYQRTADAASLFPGAWTLRSSASLSRAGRRFVYQADAGIDWLLGGSGSQAPVGALARANAAVGVGSDRFLATLELANAALVNDTGSRLHSLAASGTMFLRGVSLTAAAAVANDSHVSASAMVAYGF